MLRQSAGHFPFYFRYGYNIIKDMENTSVIVRLQDVCKSFRKDGKSLLVLNNISLEIDRASFTVLSGLSGSGKTTLLKIIGGYERPDSGNIFIDERDVGGLNDVELTNFRRQNVGMIFQDYYLDENLTFRENIELPAMFANLTDAEIKQRTTELIANTDLAKRLDHYPTEVSGGQAQRAAILRAIYLRPELILADEPTSNIDDSNAKLVLDILRELQQKGRTILIASHDARVLAYADRVIKLSEGKIT